MYICTLLILKPIKMEDSLDNLLKGTGVKPAKQENVFTKNDELLKDLFGYFGEIFSDYESKNGLPNFKNPYDETDV